MSRWRNQGSWYPRSESACQGMGSCTLRAGGERGGRREDGWCLFCINEGVGLTQCEIETESYLLCRGESFVSPCLTDGSLQNRIRYWSISGHV